MCRYLTSLDVDWLNDNELRYTDMRMNLSKKKRKIAKFPQNRLKMNEIAQFGSKKKKEFPFKQ